MPQVRCLITLRVAILQIRNYYIIRKVINEMENFRAIRKKCRAKNRALRNSSINWIFLWWLPIQSIPKPFITEKRQNKAKYLTWNSIKLKFVKKTSMPNYINSLGYIKCYSSSSPRPVKNHSNFIRCNCQKICSWSRRPKDILKIRKKARFL